jgi:hypothetical protein
MLLWGVLWIWYYTGSLEYDLVLLNETSSISMFIVISVLIGAMGKSAQILFHVWLADAMEGLNFLMSILTTKKVLVTAARCLRIYDSRVYDPRVIDSRDSNAVGITSRVIDSRDSNAVGITSRDSNAVGITSRDSNAVGITSRVIDSRDSNAVGITSRDSNAVGITSRDSQVFVLASLRTVFSPKGISPRIPFGFIGEGIRCFGSGTHKEIPILTQYQKEIIAGIMLSDGHLRNTNARLRSTGNFRLECTFKTEHLDFCKWIKLDLPLMSWDPMGGNPAPVDTFGVILASISTGTLPTPYPRENPTQYWFSTSSHAFFTELRSIWYVSQGLRVKPKALLSPVSETLGPAGPKTFGGNSVIGGTEITKGRSIKVLPSLDYLNQFFTEVSLAHAIMGDGYWEHDSQTVLICTDNFSLEEVQSFILFLASRFGLKAGTKKRGNCYRVRFSSANGNLTLLRSLITPHLHSSMLYKLGTG